MASRNQSSAIATSATAIPRKRVVYGATTIVSTDDLIGRSYQDICEDNATSKSVSNKNNLSTSELLAVLRGNHPWPAERPSVALQQEHGWLRPSTSELLARNLCNKTQLAVEIGSWLGLSTRFILNAAPNAAVIAIDHWMGSAEHHNMPDAAAMLPQLFETFQANCWESQDRLLPLRMSSLDGLKLIAEHGLQPNLVYIDADHAYESVKADLETCLDLFPQATLVGDDWDWTGVRQAVDEVTRARNIPVTVHGAAWTINPKLTQSS